MEDPREQYNDVSQLPHALNLHSVRLVLPSNKYELYHCQWSNLLFLSMGSALHPVSLDVATKVLESCTNLLDCKLYVDMLAYRELCPCLPRLKAISLFFDQQEPFNSVCIISV